MTDASKLSDQESLSDQGFDTPPVVAQRRTTSGVFTVAVVAYLCLVGGFAAWHAAGLWSWPYIVSILVIPAVLVFLLCLPSTVRALQDRSVSVALLFAVAAPILAAVTFGAMGLALGFSIVETVGQWENRTARTVAVTGGMFVCAAVTWVVYRPGRNHPKADP